MNSCGTGRFQGRTGSSEGGPMLETMKLGKGDKVMIRKTYIRKVEGRLERFVEDIDRLQNRMETSVGIAGERITQEIRDLRSKAGAVTERIRAVEKAGASNWGRLKNSVDEGLKDLGRAIDNAIESLRKTGSGGG